MIPYNELPPAFQKIFRVGMAYLSKDYLTIGQHEVAKRNRWQISLEDLEDLSKWSMMDSYHEFCFTKQPDIRFHLNDCSKLDDYSSAYYGVIVNGRFCKPNIKIHRAWCNTDLEEDDPNFLMVLKKAFNYFRSQEVPFLRISITTTVLRSLENIDGITYRKYSYFDKEHKVDNNIVFKLWEDGHPLKIVGEMNGVVFFEDER